MFEIIFIIFFSGYFQSGLRKLLSGLIQTLAILVPQQR